MVSAVFKTLPPLLAMFMAMSSALPAARGNDEHCVGTEADLGTKPILSDPYPRAAAGWGLQFDNGRMASRWAEDWTRLTADPCALEMKSAALGDDTDLAFSTELRLREVLTQNAGLVAGADMSQAQLRAILGANLRLSPHLRLFGEVGLGQVNGDRARASANFQNQAAIQQLFADVRGMHGALLIGAMFGRQEFADGPIQLISLSDGPNLHRSWNGVRTYLHEQRYRIGAFELRATRLAPDAFDDGVQPEGILRGINASFIISTGEESNTYIDPFWYHTETPGFRLGAESGLDQRNSHGLRLWGRKGALRWDWTAVRQAGRTLGNKSIRAWAFFAVQSLSLSEDGWKPRLTSHIDFASGNGMTNDHALQTFHPVYASSSYLGESQILGLSNLFMVAPGLALTPGRDATFALEFGHARRLDTGDAVYAGGMRPYAEARGIPGRHIGNLARFAAKWTPSDILSLHFNLEHLSASRALRKAGLRASTQAQFTTTYRY